MATLADVAERAGVSVATAARVLSGHGYAAEATRRSVLEASKAIGYVPNQLARSLRTRRTRLIGLLIGDVENSFYSVIARNVESAAKDAGYHVVLCNSDDDPVAEKEYLQLLDGIRVDGLIITPTSKNRRKLREFVEKGIVIIQIDRRVDKLEADAIMVDNEAAAEAAVSHLIAAGHTRIGIITGPPDVLTARQRLAGYKNALHKHGITIRQQLIRASSFHHEHAAEDAAELISERPAPTAIFAANNVLAEGCLVAVADLGLNVPRDLSIVGFDDVPWMTMISPRLTTVAQPVADMAKGAAELLLRRLRDHHQGPPRVIVFRSELLVRGSVAAVRDVQAASSA